MLPTMPAMWLRGRKLTMLIGVPLHASNVLGKVQYSDLVVNTNCTNRPQ